MGLVQETEAASEMLPLSQANWSNLHPFVPLEQAQGYQEMLKSLENSSTLLPDLQELHFNPIQGPKGNMQD